jgi:hypothetical protein
MLRTISIADVPNNSLREQQSMRTIVPSHQQSSFQSANIKRSFIQTAFIERICKQAPTKAVSDLRESEESFFRRTYCVSIHL